MKNTTLEMDIKKLYEEIKEFSESTDRLCDSHKVKAKKNSRKQNIINFLELDIRNSSSEDYFKKIVHLEVLLGREQLEAKRKLGSLSVLYEKITEKINILKELSMLIKDTKTALEGIEYQMNEKFGNEHFWKKEFSKDFLTDFRLYVKNPTEIRKDKLLKALSILSTESVRGCKNSENESFASYESLKAELDLADKELEVIRDLTGFIFMMKCEVEHIRSKTSII